MQEKNTPEMAGNASTKKVPNDGWFDGSVYKDGIVIGHYSPLDFPDGEPTQGKSNGNSHAFPSISHSALSGIQLMDGGFTKREVIAKDIMAGLTAKYSISNAEDYAIIAKTAIKLTDSLLAELAKPQGE